IRLLWFHPQRHLSQPMWAVRFRFWGQLPRLHHSSSITHSLPQLQASPAFRSIARLPSQTLELRTSHEPLMYSLTRLAAVSLPRSTLLATLGPTRRQPFSPPAAAARFRALTISGSKPTTPTARAVRQSFTTSMVH